MLTGSGFHSILAAAAKIDTEEKTRRQRERMRNKRNNPQYRDRENWNNRERKRVKRGDPEVKKRENWKDRERKREQRSDPEVKKRETDTRKEWDKKARTKVKAKTKKEEQPKRKPSTEEQKQSVRQRDREWRRVKRMDPEEKKRENQMRKEWDKNRKEWDKRALAKVKAKAKKEERWERKPSTEEQKQSVQQRDKEWRRVKRMNPGEKERENEMRKEWNASNETYEHKNKRRKLALRTYREKRSEGKLDSLCKYRVKKRGTPRNYHKVWNGSRSIVTVKNLNSKYIRNALPDADVMNVLFRFVENTVKDFPDYVYMMMPDRCKKRVCISIDFPQAMRLFFGRSKTISQFLDERSAYGLKSMLQSTGMRPYDVRVQPFTDDINTIINHIETALEPALVGTKYENCNFDFNFLEIKLYLGEKLVGEHSNKTVGAHTDCIFDDNGNQSIKDSARGDHLTVVLTFGYPRKLFFVRCSKNTTDANRAKWKEIRNHDDYLILEHNSLFVLFPEDEKPTPSETAEHIVHKTKHGVKFNGKESSFSMALVLRSVKKTSMFHSNVRLDRLNKDSPTTSLFKKDSWCWTFNEGDNGENSFPRNFLENEQYKMAFDNADKAFDKSNVLSCSNKLLNEIRRFAQK